MSEDQKPNEPKSMLSIVMAEEKKAKRDAAKAKVKAMFQDLVKARAVVSGIEEGIVAALNDVGESESDIRSLLAGE